MGKTELKKYTDKEIADQIEASLRTRYNLRHAYYLGGPMSKKPQYNFPAFFEAAKDLREQGYLIVSPAELDDFEVVKRVLKDPTGTAPTDPNAEWSDFLARDLQIVVKVKGMIVLPGWHKSKGASLESYVNCALGKPLLGVYPKLEELNRSDYIKN